MNDCSIDAIDALAPNVMPFMFLFKIMAAIAMMYFWNF